MRRAGIFVAMFAIMGALAAVDGRAASAPNAATSPPPPPASNPSAAGLANLEASFGTVTTTGAATRVATAKLPTTARTRAGAPGNVGAKTLVLYDTTGAYGWMGELYAMATGNLASHFGSWRALPVSKYSRGMVHAYTATIYIGSTHDEPVPDAFLDDVRTTSRPVVWMYANIWKLTARHADFQSTYGWMSSQYDTSDVDAVRYKGVTLDRSTLNRGGIMNYANVDPAKVRTLATAVRTDGTSFPWAVRSGNLTYIGEIPFVYTSETDRDLVFSDLLFDALAPRTQTRRRALVRLEDVSPRSDPAKLRSIADALAARKVPFGFGVSPMWRDPAGKIDPAYKQLRLRNAPAVIAAIKYMQARGGVMIEHGYTHQYGTTANPYDGVSGDDFEFFRVKENADHTLQFVGPIPGDSAKWANGRVNAANAEFKASKLAVPVIFEFPHYSASALDYRTISPRFRARWERALYFSGVLGGGKVNHSRFIGQRFPYVVRDVYGATVIPENVGSYEPEVFHQFPLHTIDDIVDGARRNKVVRDGIASLYFHPFWGPTKLVEAVDRLKADGWRFVSPTTLL